MAKILFTIGEVASQLGENPSAIRYWSNYFEQWVRPQRNGKGNRLFHEEDVETLRQIQFMLKTQGLTLDGVASRLKADHSSVDRKVKALTILKGIKEKLIAVRKAL